MANLALSQEEIVLAVAIAIFARTALYFWAKWNEKKALGEEIKFEAKYIGTAVFAGILSFFIASISTEPVLAQIPDAENYSANGLLVLILGTAFTINELANKVISALGLDRILASNSLRNKFGNMLHLQNPQHLKSEEEVKTVEVGKSVGQIEAEQDRKENADRNVFDTNEPVNK